MKARQAELGWSDWRLSEEAGVSYGSVHEFLQGKRDWPQPRIRRAIEKALGWKTGAFDRIAAGVEAAESDEQDQLLRSVDTASPAATGVRVVLDFPDEVVAGMSALALAEARANAEAAYLKTLRETKVAEGPPHP